EGGRHRPSPGRARLRPAHPGEPVRGRADANLAAPRAAHWSLAGGRGDPGRGLHAPRPATACHARVAVPPDPADRRPAVYRALARAGVAVDRALGPRGGDAARTDGPAGRGRLAPNRRGGLAAPASRTARRVRPRLVPRAPRALVQHPAPEPGDGRAPDLPRE